MQNHADAPRGEFGFDVAGQETERFVLLLQDCVQVAKRKAVHTQVSLFP